MWGNSVYLLFLGPLPDLSTFTSSSFLGLFPTAQILPGPHLLTYLRQLKTTDFGRIPEQLRRTTGH